MQPVEKEPRLEHEHVLVEFVLVQLKLTWLNIQLATKEDVSIIVDEIGEISIIYSITTMIII